MNDFSTEKAVALSGEMTVVRTTPLDRAKAISDLIAEQALASERMGRLTDKVATALLNANLFSVAFWRPSVNCFTLGADILAA